MFIKSIHVGMLKLLMLIAFYFHFLSIHICITSPSFNGLYCQSLQCKAKTARKNGRPSRQSQRCQQGNAIGMQSAQLPWQKGCRLTCLRKTFLPFGREGAGKGSSRQEGNKNLPEKGKLKQKKHHSLRRWLVQDVGVGTTNRLGSYEPGGVVCWGQAPEHGSCVFSLHARPQTRLEAAAQRPGTPSARCKLHTTPQVFSKWQKRWGPILHSKLQPQKARTGGLSRGSAAPYSDGLAFSLRSWWQQTDHTQRRREALSLAYHSWRRDQKLLAHGPPMQGCKHQPAVTVTGRSDCQIH